MCCTKITYNVNGIVNETELVLNNVCKNKVVTVNELHMRQRQEKASDSISKPPAIPQNK